MKNVYYNGTVITMDNNYICDAMVTDNDKIIFTGSNDKALSYADINANTTDLNKKVMMPSFIDSNSHLSGVASSMLKADFTEGQEAATILFG